MRKNHIDRRLIGERIRHEREAAGLSQTELGGAVGAKQETVSNWENAKQRVTADEMIAIARALGIRVGRLYGEVAAPKKAISR